MLAPLPPATVLFLLFACLHAVSLVLAVYLVIARRVTSSGPLFILLVVTAALVWDNAVLALGFLVNDHEFLEWLSAPR